MFVDTLRLKDDDLFYGIDLNFAKREKWTNIRHNTYIYIKKYIQQ